MSTTTPNLGLFKYDTSTDGKEVFSIQTALNNNWDIIDNKIPNPDLSNLTDAGNARLQYAPFAINNGTVTNGENVTLYCPMSPAIVDVAWTQPTLSANGTLGGANFAVSAGEYSSNFSAWHAFDKGGAGTYTDWYMGSAPIMTMYNPIAIKVTKITLVNCSTVTGYAEANTITSGKVQGSNDNSSWVDLKTFSNSVTAPSATWYIDLSDNTNYYTYYRIYGTCSYGGAKEITLDAVYQETIATGTDLISNPCTITTCDGRTKSFGSSSVIDVSTEADGTYNVLKDYSTGVLSLVNNFNISKTVTIGQSLTNNLIPVMTSNTEPYGTATLESGSLYGSHQAWQFFAGSSTVTEPSSASSSVSYTFTEAQEAGKYQTYFEYAQDSSAYGSRALNSYSITLYYTDNTSEVIVNKNTGSPSWSYSLTDTFVVSKPFNKITIGFSGTIYTYTIGLLRNFNLKRYVAGTGDYWLDTSVIPANFKVYNGTSWVTNNDKVLIGSVTIASNAITKVANRYFNACPYRRDLVESYENGYSWYNVYSDGWCEQGGETDIPYYTSPKTINLLKTYKNKKYSIYATKEVSSQNQTGTIQAEAIDGSSFSVSWTYNTSRYAFWMTYGYMDL